MDSTILVTFFVLLLGMVFLYFVGAVVIQALRLSIIQVKSDVQIKMEKHYQDLEENKLLMDTKRLRLKGKVEDEKKKVSVTTIELEVEDKPENLKTILESIPNVKKFAIFKNTLLLDIEGDTTPAQVIEEMEKKASITVKQVHFARHTHKREVKGD